MSNEGKLVRWIGRDGSSGGHFDSFANILHRIFLGFALAYAAGQTRAFRHPIAGFSWMEDYLTRGITSSRILTRGSKRLEKGRPGRCVDETGWAAFWSGRRDCKRCRARRERVRRRG